MEIKTLSLSLFTCALAISACGETSVATEFVTPTFANHEHYCETSAEVDTAGDDPIVNMLIEAAQSHAAGSESPQSCLDNMIQGEALFRETLTKEQAIMNTVGGYKKAKDKSLRPIQAKITDHWREDQSGRTVFLKLRTDETSGTAYWAHSLSKAHSKRVDLSAKTYLESLLKEYDWIDTKRFGKKISAHAWIIAQHADDDPEFQKKVLDRMTPYLKSGGVSKKNYAYLWDRVAVNTGGLQRYGTQPTWECKDDGTMDLKPMEDPDNVDTRREEMGMNTVEDGLIGMEKAVCG